MSTIDVVTFFFCFYGVKIITITAASMLYMIIHNEAELTSIASKISRYSSNWENKSDNIRKTK